MVTGLEEVKALRAKIRIQKHELTTLKTSNKALQIVVGAKLSETGAQVAKHTKELKEITKTFLVHSNQFLVINDTEIFEPYGSAKPVVVFKHEKLKQILG